MEAQAEADIRRLPETELSASLEGAIASALAAQQVACEPVRVRVVSSVDTSAEAKNVMLQRSWSSGGAYPERFPFRSRAVMAVQKVDGHDVIIFAMYTQEYGADCPDPNTNRVYISYVDSVKYFASQPEGHRSTVYRALIVAYLGSLRRRGFRHVHLWVEPPRAGDEYIFYARPPDERKPMKREKLRSWYVRILEKAKAEGTVARYGDMLDEFRDITSARQIPMFKGDQWEITVPALLEARGGRRHRGRRQERDDDVFERPSYHAPSASASSAAASYDGPRGGGRGGGGGGAIAPPQGRADGQIDLDGPGGQGPQADAQPAGALPRRDARSAQRRRA